MISAGVIDKPATSKTALKQVQGAFNDWKAESDKVEVLTQHACVQYESFLGFLASKKFNVEKNYSPTRANRLDWFSNDWNVG